MNAAVRSGIAQSAIAAMAVGSAIAVTPAIAGQNQIPALATVDGHTVALAGFISDQINILTSYGQQAVDETAAWVSAVVNPLITLQFWPLSGQPGNYIAGAFNSTVNFAQSLAGTAVGFVQAEIDYFTNWIPNIPNVIGNVVNYVVNAIQNVVNWITGWIPWPFAAVATPAAASKVTAARTAATRRPLARPAGAAITAVASTAAAAPSAVSAPAVSQNRKAPRSAAGKQSGRTASSRAAAKAAG